MSSVGTKHTAPEMTVRRTLHRLGYRYGLHSRNLPGSPDLVFASRRKVLFVHGCFWHGHGCRWGRLPKSRPEYWAPKIGANRSRDRRARAALRRLGWSCLTIWQCQLRDPGKAFRRIQAFLDGPDIARAGPANGLV
jgi:DNA mismatch endonuclease (patch repair protein)